MRDRERTTALGALEKRSEYVAVAMTIKEFSCCGKSG
jgi:hypothetical protein